MSLIRRAKIVCNPFVKKPNSIIRRILAVPLQRAAQANPALVLEGPRGSGKTTLLRLEFPRRLYISLEDSADRRAARADPTAFLGRLRMPAIIDDVHRAPELWRRLSQTDPAHPLILASPRRLSLPLPTLRLHHPTLAEREGRQPLPLDMLGRFTPSANPYRRIASPWPAPRTSIERDVLDLVAVRDLDRFEAFRQTAFETSGESLDQEALARRAGVSKTTAIRWLAVLEQCFETILLPQCDFPFGRRLMRSPRLHFLAGRSFASRVVSQIYRNAVHSGLEPDLRYWRDSNGMEVALVIQSPGAPPVPVAIAESPTPVDESRLRRWMSLAGVDSGAIVSARATGPLRNRIFNYNYIDL